MNSSFKWCAVWLLVLSSVAAAEIMPADVMKSTLATACGHGESVDHARQAMFQTLIDLGPAAAPAIAEDVAARLADSRSMGHSEEYLLTLAGGFGEKGASCVPPLLKIAQGQDIYVLPAVVALGRIGAPASAAVPRLIELAKTGSYQQTTEARLALGQIGGAAAKETLRGYLADKELIVQSSAAWATAQADPTADADKLRQSAVAAMVQLLQDQNSYKQQQGAYLAARFGPKVAGAVVPLLADEKTLSAAVTTLEAINFGWTPGDSQEPTDINYNHARLRPQKLLQMPPDDLKTLRAAPQLLAVAKKNGAFESQHAMMLLAALSPESDDALAAMMEKLPTANSPNDAVVNAVSLVGKKALPKLLERYNALERNKRERGLILAALIRIDPKSVPDMVTILQPPLPLPKGVMSQILAEAGSAGTTAMLNEVEPNGRRNHGGNADLDKLPPGETTIVAIMTKLATADDLAANDLTRALLQVARPQDLPVLLRELPKLPPEKQKYGIEVVGKQMSTDREMQKKYLNDPSPAIRRGVIASIYGNPADAETAGMLVSTWANDKDADVVKAAKETIQSYGGEPSLRELAKQLDGYDAAKQADAVQLIGSHGLPVATDVLLSLLSDGQPAVRAAAVAQLRQRREMQSKPWPPAEVAKLQDDPSGVVRAAFAISLIDRSGPPSPVVLKMLGDKDPAVRAAAADAIIAIGNPSRPLPAPPELADLLNDPDPAVRGKVRAMRSWSLALAIDPIKKSLAGDRVAQLSALSLLATGASPELQASIEPLTQSKDALVRTYALAALGGLPPDGPVMMRLAHVSLTDPDPNARFAARHALMVVRQSLGALPLMAPGTTQPTAPARTPIAASQPASRPIGRPFPNQGEPPAPLLVQTPLKFPDPKTDADRDSIAVANAYAGRIADEDRPRLLDMIADADPLRSGAALAALPLGAAREQAIHPTLDQSMKRPPLTRVLVALVLPSQRSRGLNQFPTTQPVDPELQQIAQGNDRAAKIGKILLSSNPAANIPVNDVLAGLDDENAVVQLNTAQQLGNLARRPDGHGMAIYQAVLKKLDDPKPEVARAIAAAGSSFNAFGDGSVRTNQMSRSEACSALAIKIAQADPSARAALVKESLTTAGQSPFFVTMWQNMLSDYDPAVRASCVQGLRTYAELWHKDR